MIEWKNEELSYRNCPNLIGLRDVWHPEVAAPVQLKFLQFISHTDCYPQFFNLFSVSEWTLCYLRYKIVRLGIRLNSINISEVVRAHLGLSHVRRSAPKQWETCFTLFSWACHFRCAGLLQVHPARCACNISYSSPIVSLLPMRTMAFFRLKWPQQTPQSGVYLVHKDPGTITASTESSESSV